MLSIGTCFNYDIPIEEQIPLIKDAGFSHVSLGADDKHTGYLDPVRIKELKNLVSNNGLQICSIHTPLSMEMDLSSVDKDVAAKTLEVYKKCIDAAELLDAEMIIFHAIGFADDTDDGRKGVLTEQVSSMLEYVDGRKIKLALENLWFPHSLEILHHCFESIKDERLGFCYDSSHDNLTPEPVKILEQYGGRLIKTHISDNYGSYDDHNLPFDGIYDWDEFHRVFAGVGFKGIFLLEVEMKQERDESVAEFLREAYKRGKKIMDNAQ